MFNHKHDFVDTDSGTHTQRRDLQSGVTKSDTKKDFLNSLIVCLHLCGEPVSQFEKYLNISDCYPPKNQ